MRLLRAMLVGLSGLVAVGCGNGGVQSPDFTPELLGITIEPTVADVPAGRTFQFHAVGEYSTPPGSNASSELHDITGSVDWSVSNTTNASIDENGLARGLVENRTVQVSATAHGKSAEPATLNIGAAVLESISIVEPDQTIPVDGTLVLHAEGTYSNGDVRPVTVTWGPASSTNTTLTPTSGDSTTVTGVSSTAPGATTIQATVVVGADTPSDPEDDATLTDSVVVTVRPLVTGLTISPTNPSRPLGLKVDFNVTATCKTGPATTATCDPASAVVWSVANAGSETNTTPVASIDAASGLANSLRVGSAVVTATADGVTATTNFTVTSPVISRIEIVSPTADTVPLDSASTPQGLAVGLKAIAVFTDNNRTPQRVNWTVTPVGLASFNPNPNAQTSARGDTLGDGTVTASAIDSTGANVNGIDSNGVSTGVQLTDSIAFSVTNAVILPATLRVVPATDSVTVGRTRTFKAVVDDSQGNAVELGSADVSWSSSNSAVAAVDDPTVGVVRGVAQNASPVTITATGLSGGRVAGRTATATIRVTDNVCTTPLTTANASTSTANTETCIACGVDNPNNILDADVNTFANMHADLALINGETSLRATATVFPPGEPTTPTPRFAGGRNAGFIVARPVGELVLAELFSQLQVRTLLGGVVQDRAGGPTPPPGAPIPLPLRVDLLGTSVNGDYELALVSVATVQPYDAIELGFNSGVATALSNVQVFQACGTANPPQGATLQQVVGIQPSGATLLVGGQRDFQLMGIYEGSSTATPIPDSDLTWTSTTPGIVSVSPNGVVEGLAPGTGTVSVTVKSGVPGAPTGAFTMNLTVVDDVCSAPLLSNATPAASITSTINGVCVLCNATNLPNVIDVPKENYATLNAPVALVNGGVSVIVNANRVVTPATGNIAGFVISRPVSPLVQAEVLSQVLVETLNAQGAVVNTSGPVIPLRLGLLGQQLGGGEQLFVGLPTTAPFTQMRLTFNSGLVTADLDQLGNINVFRACAATSGVPAP